MPKFQRHQIPNDFAAGLLDMEFHQAIEECRLKITPLAGSGSLIRSFIKSFMRGSGEAIAPEGLKTVFLLVEHLLREDLFHRLLEMYLFLNPLA
jgi:hypothetical protein